VTLFSINKTSLKKDYFILHYLLIPFFCHLVIHLGSIHFLYLDNGPPYHKKFPSLRCESNILYDLVILYSLLLVAKNAVQNIFAFLRGLDFCYLTVPLLSKILSFRNCSQNHPSLY
jgi:hypothetical protein